MTETGPSVRPAARPVARLALADGSIFAGAAFGAVDAAPVAAEVVFNTAMSGYQESLTDPSYRGQILVQTFPMVGIVGANERDMESGRVQASGLVVRELAGRHSNYRASMSLPEFLERYGVMGLAGVDTRALTRRIRSAGAMMGVLSADARASDLDLIRIAQDAGGMTGRNLAGEVSPAEATRPAADRLWRLSPPARIAQDEKLVVVALDCGAKRAIYDHLLARGCEVVAVPWDTPPDRLLAILEEEDAAGLFISNGPGDPAAVEATIEALRSILARREALPTFGICLGNQLLALAAGASTYKLKFGHRGANQPVLHAATGRVEITSQNHGFAVDRASVEAAGGEVTHVHLNDDTVAGFRLKGRPVFAVQHHPEASPGPHEAGYLFDEFVAAMRAARGAS
ncbi:MAG: glutamine-hydrolyzing carbamoyl-phosphate synthase small subunit [Planctomycetota bacterium]